MTSLNNCLSAIGVAMNEELTRLLPIASGPESRLQEAMRYSTLDGGKRLRPFFVLQTAQLFNVAEQSALRVTTGWSAARWSICGPPSWRWMWRR